MGKIIAIRKNDVNVAEGLFGNLMKETESILNTRASGGKWVTSDKSLTSSSIEREAENAIKYACRKVTEFDENEVKLIAGHKFPDIVAEKYYGVEVKSTMYDQWKSTGSSIVESTRIETVESVYLLFGKLGGSPVEFKCRPYKDVMYDIAVTHSPRYLIDMDLPKGETIFDKLKCDYDVFRNDPGAIKKIKAYYKKQAKPGQMPWWIDENESSPMPLPVNLRLWSTLQKDEKDILISLMFILFPEVVTGKYANAVLWMVSAKGVVNPSFRDPFSAGGRVNPLTWKEVEKGVPQVWKNLYQHKEVIKSLLNDSSIYPYMLEYNPSLLRSKDMYKTWVGQVGKYLKEETFAGKKYCIIDILMKD